MSIVTILNNGASAIDIQSDEAVSTTAPKGLYVELIFQLP